MNFDHLLWRLLCWGLRRFDHVLLLGTIPILGCHDSRHILVWEGKHLGKQIVVIEVLQVVYLIELTLVVLGDFLDLREYLFILNIAAPE